MSFRARLMLAFTAAVLAPILLLGLGVRAEMSRRLDEQYGDRIASATAVLREDLARESREIADRLAALAGSSGNDNRFRLAVRGAPEYRSDLLDYAGLGMRAAGLTLLQLQDEDGRILSSGHFRNDFDRVDPGLLEGLTRARGRLAVVTARRPDGPFVALARAHRFRIADRSLILVGGVAVDEEYLRRLARDRGTVVSLVYPGGEVTSQARTPADDHSISHELRLPFVPEGSVEGAQITEARLVVTHSLGALAQLRSAVDRWLLAAVIAAGLAGLALAVWLSGRLSRPLATLARKTAIVDLGALDIEFDTQRPDEIGRLSRLLDGMTGRLRASATRLREAERQATIGELARQVNHDIKNGLTPIRNVIRHLGEIARERPGELARVFRERQSTLDSGIAYLDRLSSHYAKLTPVTEPRACDLNALIREVVRDTAVGRGASVRFEADPDLPAVTGDPVAVRRIVENLLTNAIEAVDGTGGTVSVRTETIVGVTERGARVVVADTGPGMTPEEADRAFDQFYTTKPAGTGLGLPIARRLVIDLNGRIRAESTPGVGTRLIVELPGREERGDGA